MANVRDENELDDEIDESGKGRRKPASTATRARPTSRRDVRAKALETFERAARAEETSDATAAFRSPGPSTGGPNVTGHQENLGRRWYVVHTYSGYENKVKRALEKRIESMDMRDKIFQIIVPTQEEVAIKDGQRKSKTSKVYPGYVLVEMVMTDQSWYVVRNTQGVTSFVGSGNKPTPLINDDVEKVLKQLTGEETQTPRILLNVGDQVKIINGPFADFTGRINNVDQAKQKATVMVSMFGRETPLTLDFLEVEKQPA